MNGALPYAELGCDGSVLHTCAQHCQDPALVRRQHHLVVSSAEGDRGRSDLELRRLVPGALELGQQRVEQGGRMDHQVVMALPLLVEVRRHEGDAPVDDQ